MNENWSCRERVALRRIAVLLTVLVSLPAAAQSANDEPFSLRGPFTWTQKRGQFGAVVQGELKVRILPAAGTFTCFVTGAGRLEGQLKAGPSTTRIDGHVTMAASACSGTWNGATGALGGTAQLHAKTTGKTVVDIRAQGVNQHNEVPLDADSTDALILSGTVKPAGGTGTARYVKGGSFDWTVSLDGAAPAPTTPPTPEPQSLTQKLGQALGQVLTQPPPTPPPSTKPRAPASQADVDKLQAQKAQLKAELDKALEAEKAHKEFVNGLDDSAAKGAIDGLKAAAEHGAAVLDEAMKKNKWDAHAPPGTASKGWSAADKLLKLKEAISDIQDVQKTFEGVDKDVKNGAYNAERGRMLKGTAVLGKTLKIVVDKLPVVGSAGSEIVDKTFGVVVKVATERAKTGTRWDCCYADPAGDCCFGD